MNRLISASRYPIRKTDLFPESVSCLGLAAPAGPFSLSAYESACRFLTGLGIRLISRKPVLRDGVPSYLSAPAEIRAAELNDLIRNPEVQAIYCLRGGYGSVHLLDRLDWETLRRRKLPVIGYSDITALHSAMLSKRAGVAVSACMALRLETDSGSTAFRRHFRRAWGIALHQRGKYRRIAGLRILKAGPEPVEAGLFCGNLTMLASLCGTGYLPAMKGKVIFLEDIAEPVRKLDRSLMQLKLSGFFDSCAAVVFGDFKQCGDSAERDGLFRRFAAEMNCPVFSGLHYGHCSRSISLVCGEKALLRSGSLYLRDPFSEPRS